MFDKNAYIETMELFRDLPAADMESVHDHTRLVHHLAGHLFYMPEDQGEVLFILKKGRVQLYRISPDGRKLVVAVLNPGAIFGHMALIGQGLHNTYAEALDDVVICIWGREEVESLLLRKPEVTLRFLDVLGKRLLQAEQRVSEITFKRVPARLASLLLQLSIENGNACELIGYTHQGLADMLGIYRETVTQALNDFKNQNVIRLGRKRITILDSAALFAIAEES